jgi:thiol-disulfide isomerase/thioredoxin/YHS domain-containing protein
MRLTPLVLLTGCLLLACSRVTAANAVRWSEGLPDAMARAERQGKLVLIHFWSTGCAPCQRMESFVFSREDVAHAIATDFVPVKVDAVRSSGIAKQFGVTQWPTDVIATPSGRIVGQLVGQRDAVQYRSELADLASQYRYLFQPQQLADAAPTENSPRNSPYQQAQYTASGPAPHQQLPAQQWTDNSTTRPGGERWGNQPYGQRGGVSGGPYGQRAQDHGRQYADSRSAASSEPSFSRPSYGPAPSGPPSYGRQPGENRWGAGQGAVSDNRANDQGGAFQRAGQRGASNGPAPSNITPPPQQRAPASQVIHNPYGGQVTPPQSPQLPGAAAAAPGQPPRNPAGASAGNPPAATGPAAPPRPHTPPTNPPIVLDGYCPVTLMETQKKWTKGDPRYGAIHRGRTYLFAGPDEQKRFLSNPDYYSPALSGYDPVRFAEGGQTVDGNRKHGVFYNEQVYLFADEASLQRFWQSPQHYAEVVHQAMMNSGGGQQRR